MKKHIISFILTCLLSVSSFAQFSKTHYIPPISNSAGQSADNQYLYISCPSLTPINFNITQLGGAPIVGTVSRDTPFVYFIGNGPGTQLLIDQGDVNNIKNDKGFIIEADDLVYASIRVAAGGGFHAGSIVSKGLAALGTKFRIGGFINTLAPSPGNNHYTFATILATENNTTISFGDIKTGTVLVDGTPEVGGSINNVVLNSGESYAIAANGNSIVDGLIGAFIQSDKPIAVNCGSFSGSNSATSNLDVGMDQIVSVERLVSGTDAATGIEYSEYIFIKANGVADVEKPLIIANENNTEVFLNGSTTPTATLAAGQYLALNGSNFSVNNNLYIKTSKKAFAFQGLGGSASPANQNMHFLPPLSCQTPKTINNIPFINSIGADNAYTGTVCIVTETGATLDFIINGTNHTLASLPAGVNATGPSTVTGNTNFVTYILTGMTGNVSAFSSKQIYLSYFGSSGAATIGGFYSGFTFKPAVTFQPVVSTVSNCIPNVNLSVTSLSGFDQFQWYFNGVSLGTAATPSATLSTYPPSQPGYYKVNATLSACGISIFSDEFPVSDCPVDNDNDGVNDNADRDFDNDGISNCTESYGDKDIDISNSAVGNITVGTYSNSFTGLITTSTSASATPFVGSNNGSFISTVPAGKTNWVKYELTFAQPMNVGIQYINTAAASDLLNSNAEFVVNSPINKTITVINPTNQLLIDTNYDGFYESGITQFSSFDIRFRLNSAVPLAAGTGTFSFLTNRSSSISFTHKNLLDTNPNSVSLKFIATCVPKDSDSDSIPDQLDLDTDNDGILDKNELMSQVFVAPSGLDANKNGMDDAYESLVAADSDNDLIKDYLDLDSDNDGIYDLVESGSAAVDVFPVDGEIDGLPASFGTNGLSNSVETVADNGVLNYTIANTDTVYPNNYADSDSDDDLCNDVIEAGFLDSNNDGFLGTTAPPTVISKGIVTSGTGYTAPHINYITAAPISISVQPAPISTCELQGTATFTVTSTAVDGYQWQVSTDGGLTYTNLANNATYSNVTTVLLSVSNPTASMAGYKYRVYLTKTGNTCGLYSAPATLTTWALPILTSPVSLKQCDDDTDGISVINLTQKNSFISANYLTETFTYHNSQPDAQNNIGAISNPTAFTNTTATTPIWVRVVNTNGCFSVSLLNVTVATTAINPTSFHKYRYKCDDYLSATANDYDGFAEFDFSGVTADVNALLPPPTSAYSIKYYKNLADAQSELNEILNISTYRNVVANTQDVYVRVDSNINNDCFGFGRVTLTVEKLPVFNAVGVANLIRLCDDNQDGQLGFPTLGLEAQILNGQTNKAFTYFDAVTNAPLPSPLPNPFPVNVTRSVKVHIANVGGTASDGPCFTEKIITFLVDMLPQNFANTIPPALLIICDDESDPLLQNGLLDFDTSTFNTTILGGQVGMNLSYTYKDLNGVTITAPSLPNPFTSGTQTVTATVTNPLNTTCPIVLPIKFEVKPVPKINLTGDVEMVCANLPLLTVRLNAGIADGTSPLIYTYVWKLGTVTLPQTTQTIVVNTAGTYTVTVTNSVGCSATRSITVNSSTIASVQDIEIVELTDINSITIIATGAGGDFVYALDDEDSYQTSNVFNNVYIGFHTVYIKDKNGCGKVKKDIAVMGAPQFFTPNGDGISDYWNLKGVSKLFNYKTVINIYDRFGILLKQITPGTIGWDGTLNGKPANADDYWYIIELADGRTTKGHFSLKR